MSKPKPLIDSVRAFCKWHLGKDCFAPFTGQDYPAWCAFVHLVQCYSHGGGEHAIAAMRETVRCAQDKVSVLCVFVQAIPAVMDWCHVREIWPRVSELHAGMYAIERSSPESSHPNRVWHHGLGAPSTHIEVMS